MNTKPKVLAIASPGGHWIQLNKICNPLDSFFEMVYVTPGAKFSAKNSPNKRIITIIDANANSKVKLIVLGFQLLKIFIVERPKYIISTGAAPGAIAIMLAKYLPITTIWVDSIANVSQLSRSGKIAQKYASLTLSQWKSLTDDKTVFFKGSLL